MEFFPNEIVRPERGDLLISEPFLPDPNFERSVVLICEHNTDGAFGLILNKPSILKVADVMDRDTNFGQTMYIGGPVQQDTLHFIHSLDGDIPDSLALANGLYWGGNFESVMALIDTEQLGGQIKFFLGYSGWSSGQLMTEMEQKSWIVCRSASPEDVFNVDPDKLWKEVLKNMGGKYKMFSNYPTDPRLN